MRFAYVVLTALTAMPVMAQVVEETDVVTAPPVAVAPGSVAVAPAGATSVDGAVLTLEAAIDMALANNELIGQNESGARRARAQVREMSSFGLPQVTVTGQITRQKEVSTVFPLPDPVSGEPTPTTIVLNPGTSRVANASVSQLIDVFGLVRKAREIGNISARVEELNIARARSEVIYGTRASYYTVLRAAGAVGVAQAAVTDAEEQMRLARAFVEAGTAPQFDVTRAEVLLADRQQTLITARDNLSLAGAALNNVLGRAVDTPLNIAPIAGTPDRVVDIAAQTERALEARPEIEQIDLGIRAGEVNVDLQRLNNYPTLAFGANYNYNFTASGFSPEKGNWNLGLNASWPLYQGGETRAKVDQAREQVRTAELQRSQLRRGVALEVRQAGLRVQETADRFAVADKAVSLAEEALRLARVRYQNGVTTQLEVTDAETSLTQARFNRNNSLYDHLTARATFDAAVLGRMPSGFSAAASSSTDASVVSGGATSSGGVSGSFNAGATGTGGAGAQGQSF